MCGLNAIVTHPENSKNTSKWRVSDVGTAQARREDTRGNYRNVRIYAAPFAKPFFTSGYIQDINKYLVSEIRVPISLGIGPTMKCIE